MAAVASRPRRPDNSSKSGALGNLRFARAALENRLLTRSATGDQSSVDAEAGSRPREEVVTFGRARPAPARPPRR
ncbi:hypothetical protein EVAR_103660_1 [Eumeta japonica]|uniref:Uncharacterized protein n=1 Tax=Eumeta variegata TaxID=151549 RepID=A0A4C1Z0E9_EUMVA|nr:hypothetical protein EVAR_103660_1 [Eumeta japonica]